MLKLIVVTKFTFEGGFITILISGDIEYER